MTSLPTVLITGATGRQGGAVLRSLIGQPFHLRAMTRTPEGDAARALEALGAEIVRGDLNDPSSLERALDGAWGVFAVQNTWEAGIAGEEEQGKRIAMLARTAGVHHYVYTSMGSAHRRTGIPHFDNKARVEAVVREAGFPSWAILRPVFVMESLTSPWFLRGDSLVTAMDPATTLQMIAAGDIGRFGARLIADARTFNGREIDVAGDAVTVPGAAATFSAAMKRTISYVQIPIADVRRHSEDVAVMIEWFDRVGYDADIPALEREFGFRPLTLAQWATRLVP